MIASEAFYAPPREKQARGNTARLCVCMPWHIKSLIHTERRVNSKNACITPEVAPKSHCHFGAQPGPIPPHTHTLLGQSYQTHTGRPGWKGERSEGGDNWHPSLPCHVAYWDIPKWHGLSALNTLIRDTGLESLFYTQDHILTPTTPETERETQIDRDRWIEERETQINRDRERWIEERERDRQRQREVNQGERGREVVWEREWRAESWWTGKKETHCPSSFQTISYRVEGNMTHSIYIRVM